MAGDVSGFTRAFLRDMGNRGDRAADGAMSWRGLLNLVLMLQSCLLMGRLRRFQVIHVLEGALTDCAVCADGRSFR